MLLLNLISEPWLPIDTQVKVSYSLSSLEHKFVRAVNPSYFLMK